MMDRDDEKRTPSNSTTLDQALLLKTLVAVKKGDFSVRLPVEWTGLAGKIADTLNDIIDLNAHLAGELQRVSQVVGKEGETSERSSLGEAQGAWKGCSDSLNGLIDDMVRPTNELTHLITGVAQGDLSQRMTLELDGRPLRGGFLRTAIMANTMVEQLNSFASEVTRVAGEVGTEGKLGGQADVKGVSGTWRDLTDSVNFMAASLTGQVRNIAQVTTAVANGDLTKKITVEAKGEILELKNTINTMVDQLNSFASEVTRVAREVGAEGKLGGQADVKGVSGTWRDLTNSVNFMATSLTGQVRNIAEVATAVANGDLSRKITVDARGEILELKNTINTMVDQLNSFASEVTRVAREVGTEGKLGGQADVKGVSGTWSDLTDNVNVMAGSLTEQVRNIAEVATAVANGDLSRKITVDARGEILELKNTINIMVDQLRSFASEVTRVAREVGTDGKLGGQADVKGVSGTWSDLTDSVNLMASNLTGQVRNIAEVTTAVANGDLSKKITVDAKGEILELKNTINIMVDQLNSFASEVSRVAREVGTEGKLGGQAQVRGVAGTWKDLTDNVNLMAGSLTGQVRNIAEVATAVANGDLSKKITVDAKGEILELKNTINTMVDQLNSFASEVTRVAREVGTEGKLGGQAEVKGIAGELLLFGTWRDLTDSVNLMASNLTAQVRNIAEVTIAVANGDLSKKITVDVRGEFLQLKETINTMVDQLRSFASEVTRVAREVGTDGKLGGQAYVSGVAGTWKDLTDNVNFMASNLTGQVRNIAQVTTAVANGDLSKKITVEARGEILELKNTINIMVDQLNSFASEVSRVAREVGTEGKLGGQAQVKGVSGTWKDLTDNVNSMAANLTDQVRGIAKVVTAVANGDLKQTLTVQAKGEIASLADTINSMIDTLATFADQVTTVAREVGVEGRLGGQANVPGAAGTWRDLTDNVNRLAANLTTQVRAIAEVATAVTRGDLTRSIQVEASGEVAVLKDNVNQMIANLRETTRVNAEQDWLKTNLAKFTRMLQGERDLLTVGKRVLSELAPVVSAQHGVFYLRDGQQQARDPKLKLIASYAYKERKNLATQFRFGEGLVGQAALEKERILLTNVPDDYIQITSGLGQGTPCNIIVLPVLFESEVKAVVELASFERFSPVHQAFLEQFSESLGIVLNTIEATMRTEELLKQSQAMAEELRSRQQALQRANEELEEKARQLAGQNAEVERKNAEVERKNAEVERARQALEEKAEQLARTSKYKSEFLSNMSHELRTPLNSLLLLSEQLAQNAEKNLTPKQVEFARVIHASGSDLLTLINDILDLSRIESGTVKLELTEAPFTEVRDYVERTFRPVADDKKLKFTVELDPDLPMYIYTDAQRLEQVLKNLLSNALKFTEKGSVALRISSARGGWSPNHDILSRAGAVIAFSVADTGIGVPPEKQQVIFEAFQQADSTTTRKYGGTGLGLSISREITKLLGGEIRLVSEPDVGSTFTLYLPQTYIAPSTGLGAMAGPSGGGAPAMPLGSYGTLPAVPRPPLAGAGVGAVPAPRATPEVKLVTPLPEQVTDDRNQIRPGDRTVLIVENDPVFATGLMEAARRQGFKVLVTSRGESARTLASSFKPSAISLDIYLPDIDGWTVLAGLKENPDTRHIPVAIVTVEAQEDQRRRGLSMGAIAYITKPTSEEALNGVFADIRQFLERPVKRLLVAEDDEDRRNATAMIIGNGDVQITTVGTGAEALQALRSELFDCVVLDPDLPDMDGFAVLEAMRDEAKLRPVPIILYPDRDLTADETARVAKLAARLIVRDCRSPERLVDQTVLFLHRPVGQLPAEKQRMLEPLYRAETALAGKKILIVDDDIRNLFALTAILERHQAQVVPAENGKEAIEILRSTPDIDLVLMDIMMPGMDGYETIRVIRSERQMKSLPIIALTAKAMKGDRETSIEAGASDYIAKPVNTAQLLSMLKVWLRK